LKAGYQKLVVHIARMSQEISRTLNCVLLGDAGVGKSSLLIVYTINEFPGEFVPTIFENYQKNVSVGIEVISVIFDDSANLMKRPDSSTHDKADAFLLCYAVNDAHSLENIKEKWFGEIKHLSPSSWLEPSVIYEILRLPKSKRAQLERVFLCRKKMQIQLVKR
jgi:GTPase SAR1 family protein